jgi:hypothetical protein
MAALMERWRSLKQDAATVNAQLKQAGLPELKL